MIRYKGYEFETIEEVKAAQEAGLIEKHDTLLPSSHNQPAHGLFTDANLGGLWTGQGAEQDVYHTIVRPTGQQFLSELFNPKLSVIRIPEFDVLSGVRGWQGTTASDACDDAPRPGEAKLCTLRADFGELNADTDRITLVKEGGRINRGDVDRRVVNQLNFSPFIPEIVRGGDLNSNVGLTLMRLGIGIERAIMRTLFVGVEGTQGDVGTESIVWSNEFDGFDTLITNTVTDVYGNTCTAAASEVFDWNNTDVNSTVNGADIVDVLSGITHKLMQIADDTMLPAEWRIVMHPDLFYRLTQIWPCSYLTNQCTATGQERLIVGGNEQVSMRDEMRTGSYLWINGVRWPVVQTTAVTQTTLGQGFSSPIYIVPLYALGRKVTYLEGFDLNNTTIQQWNELVPDGQYRSINGGLYAVMRRQTRFCVEYAFNSQMRLVMRTPWLAARVENVNYAIAGQFYSRSHDPNAAYHADGGQYSNTDLIR